MQDKNLWMRCIKLSVSIQNREYELSQICLHFGEANHTVHASFLILSNYFCFSLTRNFNVSFKKTKPSEISQLTWMSTEAGDWTIYCINVYLLRCIKIDHFYNDKWLFVIVNDYYIYSIHIVLYHQSILG